MTTIELEDLGRGPPQDRTGMLPPSYEEAVGGSQSNNSSNGGFLQTLKKIHKQQRCVDPYGSGEPPCCKLCAISILVALLLMSIMLFAAIATITFLCKVHGYLLNPISLMLCTLLILLIRLSGFLTEVLASVGAVIQSLFMVCAMLCVSLAQYVSDAPTAIEVLTTMNPTTLCVLIIVLLGLSVFGAMLALSFYFNLVWCIRGGLWRVLLCLWALYVFLAISSVLLISGNPLIHLMAAIAVIVSICCMMAPGKLIKTSCYFHKQRAAAVGSVSTLGRGRSTVQTRDTGRPMREDDFTVLDGVKGHLLSIVTVLLVLLLIPFIMMINQGVHWSLDVNTRELGILCVLCMVVGMWIILLFFKTQRMASCLATIMGFFLIILSFLLLILRFNRAAVFLYILGASILVTSIIVVLRNTIRDPARLLAAATCVKCLFCLLCLVVCGAPMLVFYVGSSA
nr:hypothetical protein PsAHV6-032 [Psittacid alphaherpesvirus 6]